MEKDIPQFKKEEKGVALITEQATKFIIKSDNDVKKATEILVEIKNQKKAVEEERKSYTQPLNLSLKRINERAKEIMQPLEAAEKILKTGVVDYRAVQEKERLVEEKRLKKEQGKNVYIEPKPTIIESASGELRMHKVWKFKITNEAKIPREYMKIDETLIRAAIKSDVRKIEGVKIYQEEEPRTY